MARINIEDSLFSDARFFELAIKLGSHELAMGAMVYAYKLAQKFWVPNKYPIPADQFRSSKIRKEIIDVGLAEINEDGAIYIKGSEDQFAWLIQRSKAGLNNKGKKAKRKRTEVNGSERLESSSSYSSSYSSSDSISSSDITKSTNFSNSHELAPDVEKTNLIIACFCREYEKRYGVKYRVTGKDAGILKRLGKNIGSLQTAEKIIIAYLNMPDQWFINKRHDAATLEQNLAKVSQFEQSGKLITQAQLKTIDQKTTNQALLEKIERGEL